jgi:hypothetical protein
MFLTFEAATQRIRIAEGKRPAKNPQYYYTFIYALIRQGEIERAQPDELFVKSDVGFQSIGKVSTEALITQKSIEDYIDRRAKERAEKGCNTKGGKPIEAIFSDGSRSQFNTTTEVMRFFGIKYYTLRRAMETNTAVPIKVTKARCKKLGVEPEIAEQLTEDVKFRYI